MCNAEALRFPTPPFSDDCFYSHDKILAHKVPTVVVEGCNLGLKVYATLTLDNVMIAQTLIPRNIAKDALAVHINPGFLKAENPPCSEVDATVVEIVANGDLLECQAQRSSELDYMELTKALQFFIAQTWPTYPDVSAAPSVSNLRGYKGLSTRLTL